MLKTGEAPAGAEGARGGRGARGGGTHGPASGPAAALRSKDASNSGDKTAPLLNQLKRNRSSDWGGGNGCNSNSPTNIPGLLWPVQWSAFSAAVSKIAI